MIDPARVEEVFKNCLIEDGDSHTALEIEGILHTAVFDRAKLADYHHEIAGMLEQMQDQFKPVDKGGGGGWSFLNICEDRDGNLWTGVHWTCEMLIQLGIATDQASWLGPRELWQAFPGGMPYVVVNPC